MSRVRLALLTAMLMSCRSAPEPPVTSQPADAPADAPAIATAVDAKVPAVKPSPLSTPLEAELAELQRDPGEAIGFGEKAYLPYEPNVGTSLINSDDPAVTARLLAEVTGSGDRVYRLAVLHVLGKRTDATVDAALIVALDDPALRATAAYLLGRSGFKGYPERPRDLPAVQVALRRWLDDADSFDDPFYRKTFRTGDFVLGAFIRVTGTARFRIPASVDADLIGLALPSLSATDRNDLLAQAQQLD